MKQRKRTIVLELLRHGPARGQLLSPSTPYLALCGDHAVQTFHVPLEHVDYQAREEGLGYRQRDPVVAGTALREATRDVSRTLASIPALTGELGAATTEDVVHLRLVLSAAELAALPFELANAPPGTPNEGRSLLLDGSPRVVLTRGSRRVPPAPVPWPDRPRVLFAFAAPAGLPPVPVDAHLLALRRALDPWIGWSDSPLDEIGHHLTVLPNASLEAIERACRAACQDGRRPYTHVHVLAHGVKRPVPGSRETRHYLALHRQHGDDGVDAVDGVRLEEALRPLPKARAALAVVTVASCDSGRFGSVIAGGANIAHELHEAGIPLVVASQFPLSFLGSVILVDRLYEELLRGADPILATHEVRRALHALASDRNHDWASLVAYASLPPDIDAQVTRARLHRLRRAGDVALARAERRLEEEKPRAKGVKRPANDAEKAFDAAFHQMEAFAREQPRHAADAFAWLASAATRWAHALHKAGITQAAEAPIPEGSGASSLPELPLDEILRLAEHACHEVFARDAAQAWALVQVLNLRWTREGTIDPADWAAAFWLASRNRCSTDEKKRRSAQDDLAQLCLLALALPGGAPGRPADPAAETKEHVEKVLGFEGPGSWDAFTLRRQMLRRATWGKAGQGSDVAKLAEALEADLKARGVPERWNER